MIILQDGQRHVTSTQPGNQGSRHLLAATRRPERAVAQKQQISAACPEYQSEADKPELCFGGAHVCSRVVVGQFFEAQLAMPLYRWCGGRQRIQAGPICARGKWGEHLTNTYHLAIEVVDDNSCLTARILLRLLTATAV